MTPPNHVTRIATAVMTYAKPGNRHWRVRCPICQGPWEGAGRPSLVLWEGNTEGWRTACMNGRADCTSSAIRLVVHRMLFAGKSEPVLRSVSDAVIEGTLRAQRIFAEAEPIRQGDPCDLFLRRYRADFDPALLKYVRRGPGKRFGESALIEGLLDPISVIEPFSSNPPILGVTMTYLRRDGEPVIIASPDTPMTKHIGRRQGLACPMGEWDGGTVAISVRAGHTLRHMQSSGLSFGLAVAKAETLPYAFLPLGEQFQYDVSVANDGLSLALAETLKESMAALNTSVYIDAKVAA